MGLVTGEGPRIAHVTTIDMTLRFLLMGQLTELKKRGFDVTTISAPGPWVKELEDRGLRHIAWTQATRSWDPVSDVRAFGELLDIFRRERFDLVHTHNPKPGVLGRVAARVAGVPCVVNTVHGFYATPEDRPFKKASVLALEWLAARCSDLELYQSEEDLRWSHRLRIVRTKGLLLGNGADLSYFDPDVVNEERISELRREFGFSSGDVVIGTIGRLVKEKGYLELFRAARTARSANPRIKFLVVGERDGAKADSITGDDIRGARKDVVFVGWRDDVRDLLAAMDVFALPSWREGVPRSAIEAAAMGKPLVLTDIRGCREVVRDDREGILIPPRDQHALATAILKLGGDPGVRHRYGAAARARARESFDERRVIRMVVESSEDALRARGVILGPGGPGVRPARRADAPSLARLHADSLPDAFLPQLGQRFLRILYRALVADHEAIVLVAEDTTGILGLVAGVPSVSGFDRRFRRRSGLVAALAAAPHLVRPNVLRSLIETARHSGGADGLPEAELLSIAVAPRARENGLGAELTKTLMSELARRSVGELKVVVGADNAAANHFYAHLGFAYHGPTSVHRGVRSNIWVAACRS